MTPDHLALAKTALGNFLGARAFRKLAHAYFCLGKIADGKRCLRKARNCLTDTRVNAILFEVRTPFLT